MGNVCEATGTSQTFDLGGSRRGTDCSGCEKDKAGMVQLQAHEKTSGNRKLDSSCWNEGIINRAEDNTGRDGRTR